MSITEEAFGLLAEGGVDQSIIDLVLAALRGREALENVLDAGVPLPVGPTEEPSAGSGPSIYLSDITVAGFRGIGPESTIRFTPGPGLTVVVGRNGSGKSSFSDALEVALTGDSYRWIGKPAEWKNGWRNLHQPADSRIDARFQVEGVAGETTVHCSWDDDVTKVDDAHAWAQHHGERRTDLDGLGWTSPLALYRPLLSYSELGVISTKPSTLFDALSGALGLDEMTGAAEVLRKARLDREGREKQAAATLKNDIRPALDALDDERARTCAQLLAGKHWELDSVRNLVVGAAQTDPTLGALAKLAVPGADEVAAAVDRLRRASAALAEVAGTDTARARELADLLSAALEHHRHRSDELCPICGVGTLDASWKERTEAQVASMAEQARRYDTAQAEAAEAEAAARLVARPLQLPDTSPIALDTLRSAAHAFSTLPNEPDAAADHLESTYPPLADAAAEVIERAARAFSEAEAAWRPVAARVAAWLQDAQAAVAAREEVTNIKKAETAAKTVAAAMRSRRFEPIAGQSLDLWHKLRLQSNVELVSVELAGDGTRRRVDLDVKVDGTEGSALGVVSQGEINCLTLSLFFPRATLPESPFRFIVIDDPIQAMDPARVDGLAKVFTDIARDRQVIVFTHDDRLPESLRRLGLPHTTKEVTRRPGSVVSVRDVIDPVSQYFKDARAVAADTQLLDGVAERVVPGMCRLGLEAAFAERARHDLLFHGGAHDAVEQRIQDARKLYEISALALFGDAAEGGRVLGELNKWGKEFGDVFRDCNEGAHRGFHGSLKDLVNTAGALAERVRR